MPAIADVRHIIFFPVSMIPDTSGVRRAWILAGLVLIGGEGDDPSGALGDACSGPLILECHQPLG